MDPLADVPPPRHAIESDDEDEDERIPGVGCQKRDPVDVVEIVFKTETTNLEKRLPLIVACSRQAGKALSRLLEHHPISSRLYANSTEIGYLIQLQSSKCTILFAESVPHQGVLPLAYMYPFAQRVIEQLDPSRVSILDTYSHPTYASAEPSRTVYDAPVRYLLNDTSEQGAETIKRVLGVTPAMDIQPFSPPNLIHSLSAAFMNVLSQPASERLNAKDLAVLLLLLPSPLIGLLPSMRPRLPGPVDKNGDASFEYSDDGFLWSSEVFLAVVRALFVFAGLDMNHQDVEDMLKIDGDKYVMLGGVKRGKDWWQQNVDESGMYI